MTATATILWAMNLFFDTLGQLAFKAAAAHGEQTSLLAGWRKMLVNKWIWVGVGSFAFEFFLWLAFLAMVPLSMGILVGSLNILTVMIGGRILYKEKLTPRRVAAVSLVALGVILVGWV